jgi:hypothetical protein
MLTSTSQDDKGDKMTVFTDAAAKVIEAYGVGPTGEDQDNPEWKDLVLRQMYTWWPDLFQFLDELSELPPPKNGNGTVTQEELDAWEESDEEVDPSDQIVPANSQASASDDETAQFPAVRADEAPADVNFVKEPGDDGNSDK